MTDPRFTPDWDHIERLVDASIRRGEITVNRGAEILGIGLPMMREVAAQFADEPIETCSCKSTLEQK